MPDLRKIPSDADEIFVRDNPVGASLLAKASGQSMSMLKVLLPSRAGSHPPLISLPMQAGSAHKV
jgi:hypothetical protein